jgi:hypothetical protein
MVPLMPLMMVSAKFWSVFSFTIAAIGSVASR